MASWAIHQPLCPLYRVMHCAHRCAVSAIWMEPHLVLPLFSLFTVPLWSATSPATASEQRRVNNVVSFLSRPGGAIYVQEKNLTHTNIDLIIVRPIHPWTSSAFVSSYLPLSQVHPNHLHRLASLVPGMLECRLNPSIMFVRGIDYLESCCKRQVLLTPHPNDTIYPSGPLSLAPSLRLICTDRDAVGRY